MRIKAFCLVSLLIVQLTLSGWAFPANAATQNPDNPSFEEQVLRIIRTHPEVVLESIQAYQHQQYEKQQERQRALIKELSTHPQDIVGVSPRLGSSNRVVLVEFSDFQCPFCARAHQSLKQFVEKHDHEITFVYKHLPLTEIHSEAMSAAKAAWAAGQQGKFWQYHDALFEQQESLGEDLYVSLAEKLKLNLEKFDYDRTEEGATTAIQKDVDLARKLEIRGTPFFIMNEEVFSGAVSLAEIESIFSRVNKVGK